MINEAHISGKNIDLLSGIFDEIFECAKYPADRVLFSTEKAGVGLALVNLEQHAEIIIAETKNKNININKSEQRK